MGPRPVPREARARAILLTGVAGVLGGILLFVVVANVFGTGADSDESVAATFDIGPADERARTVAEGGPLLFQDPLGRGRDIYVQHLGGDDWQAFEARAPGAGPGCLLQWTPDAQEFVDPCDGRSYPADGAGLVQYPADVDDGERVVIDLRQPSSPTTAAPGRPAAARQPAGRHPRGRRWC